MEARGAYVLVREHGDPRRHSKAWHYATGTGLKLEYVGLPETGITREKKLLIL